MAYTVMARCNACMRTAGPSGSRRIHAQPCRPAVAMARFCRPMLSPSRAFYRGGSWEPSSYDAEAVKKWQQYVDEMAKRSGVSGEVFWPGGRYTFGRGKPCNSQQQQQQGASAAPSDAAAAGGPASTPQLALDVVADDSFYLLYADVAGLAKADLSIKLSPKDRLLKISGERKAPVEGDVFSVRERAAGPFARNWVLPDDADSEGISAKVTEGVLTITVPKKQQEPEVDDAQEVFIA